MANYWLMKTEPETFSFQDMVKDGEATWDGVRNYQARNNMMEMKKGDLVLIYHSVSDKEVVGIAKVSQTHFPDPTIDDPRWVAVKLIPVEEIKNPVTLAQIKATAGFEDFLLVNHTRLSVMPVSKKHYLMIMDMSKQASTKTKSK